MRYEKDFKEFLELLNKNQVKFCVIGAFAVGLHGKPRYTKDIDILLDPSCENGEKVIKTLSEFSFKELANQLKKEDFEKKDNIIQLGKEPVRIDLVMSVEGMNFNEIWKNKRKTSYYGTDIFYIGLNELIKSKENTGRPIDSIDIDSLKRVNKLD